MASEATCSVLFLDIFILIFLLATETTMLKCFCDDALVLVTALVYAGPLRMSEF